MVGLPALVSRLSTRRVQPVARVLSRAEDNPPAFLAGFGFQHPLDSCAKKPAAFASGVHVDEWKLTAIPSDNLNWAHCATAFDAFSGGLVRVRAHGGDRSTGGR